MKDEVTSEMIEILREEGKVALLYWLNLAARNKETPMNWTYKLRQKIEPTQKKNRKLAFEMVVVSMTGRSQNKKKGQLWDVLRRRQIGKQLMECIERLYSHRRSYIQMGNEKSQGFTSPSGFQTRMYTEPYAFFYYNLTVGKKFSRLTRKNFQRFTCRHSLSIALYNTSTVCRFWWSRWYLSIAKT